MASNPVVTSTSRPNPTCGGYSEIALCMQQTQVLTTTTTGNCSTVGGEIKGNSGDGQRLPSFAVHCKLHKQIRQARFAAVFRGLWARRLRYFSSHWKKHCSNAPSHMQRTVFPIFTTLEPPTSKTIPTHVGRWANCCQNTSLSSTGSGRKSWLHLTDHVQSADNWISRLVVAIIAQRDAARARL